MTGKTDTGKWLDDCEDAQNELDRLREENAAMRRLLKENQFSARDRDGGDTCRHCDFGPGHFDWCPLGQALKDNAQEAEAS